jgi:hypothetical protein
VADWILAVAPPPPSSNEELQLRSLSTKPKNWVSHTPEVGLGATAWHSGGLAQASATFPLDGNTVGVIADFCNEALATFEALLAARDADFDGFQ